MTRPSRHIPPHVAYVMKRYPRLSETFILNEIRTMERLGTRLSLFSLLQPEPPPHHPMVKDVKAPLAHLPAARIQAAAALARAHGACLRQAPLRYAHALGRAVYSSMISRRPFGVWKQFARAGFVADRCRQTGVTLIHAHFANAPAAVAWFASAMTGIPYSFTTHAKDLYLTAPRTLCRRVRDASFVTSCTRYNIEYLKSITPPAHHAKLHLIYHGIDLDRFALRSPAPSSAEPGPPLILSVGRLVPKKGHDDLIAACDLLKRHGIPFRCQIVGDGPLRAELAADIARRDLTGQVSLAGALTHADLIALYRAAEIFALSPRIVADGDRDGIPNVIVEAMAIGIPIVSTTISGIPEVISDDSTGLLVPPQAPAALAAALQRLLGSPPLRRRLGLAARARLEGGLDSRETTKRLRALMLACGSCRHGGAQDHATHTETDPTSPAATAAAAE